jgi:translation initiation factor 2B subunit (eIF-2B alpha/beta/delta family)
MANLRSLAAHADGAASVADFVTWLARRAQTLEQLPERLANSAWPRIESSDRVVTVSRSTAVAAVLEGAWARGWSGQAVVLDGTAAGRGQDQARHLVASGRAVSQPDAAAPSWLEGEAVVVVVGADAVGRRRFVNCTGTRSLLELARERRVEAVLVADSGKDVDDEVVDEIVRLSPRHRESPHREWPIFEAVPLHLVTTRIAE